MLLKAKNILVTGGVGFVGSHLVEALIKEGAKVVAVDISDDSRSYFFTENLQKKSTFIRSNLCDYQKLKAIVKKYRIEFIFHLAAQALVDVAYKDPKGTLENNIISTINIMEIARLNKKIKGVIVASSDKAYGKLSDKILRTSEVRRRYLIDKTSEVNINLKYKETDPLAGDHPYEVSKSATDLIAASYYKTYKTPVVVTRFGNIYGEGDLNFSRIIPGIMQSLVTRSTLHVRSNGKYIRDYLYVKDVVNGYLLLAKNIDKTQGQAFNFGSNETLSVIELIKLIEKTLKTKIRYKILNIAKNEIPYQSLDWSKIRKFLDWHPRYIVKNTAEKTYRWYKELGLSYYKKLAAKDKRRVAMVFNKKN